MHSYIHWSIFTILYTTLALSSNAQGCKPAYIDFSEVATLRETQFSVVDGPDGYQLSPEGLRLILTKPEGRVGTKGNVNDKLGQGVTLASDWTFTYGKVTYELTAPDVAGVVTAAITMGAHTKDEIDVEILGSDSSHFQTNIFTPTPEDPDPHYATLFSTQPVSGGITKMHKYSVEWTEDSITWGLDGEKMKTVRKEETKQKGLYHFPGHESSVHLGIWDASSPTGTSEWAGGPIDWDRSPEEIVALVKSVRLECL